MFKVVKNEQYAQINIESNSFDSPLIEDLEKKIAGLYREGYYNFIFDFNQIESIAPLGLNLIKKVDKICKNENGILIITTENIEIVGELDSAKIDDLTVMNTNEEAAEAIYLNELENEFREEEDSEPDEFGEDARPDYE